MIVNLFKNLIIIEDVSQHEYEELGNYKVEFLGTSNGIYMLDIFKDGTRIITIRTNNLIVIDKR